MKLYKIVTAAGTTEFVNADRSEREGGRVNLFVGDEEVGSFQSPSSYNVVEEVQLPAQQTPEDTPST